jgi:DNA-binding CsgD family transcriptional regulator
MGSRGLATPGKVEGIFGRDDELGRVREFVAATGPCAATLLIEGEAGMGKTALWQAGVAAAREQPRVVLTARPAEAERDLSFAALGDLLSDVLDDTLDGLPEPQRRALAVALLLEEPGGSAPESRAVAMALIGVLKNLAEAGVVLVAVDDLQWLDPPSASALQFALRRTDPAPVRLLATRRASAENGFAAEAVERLELEPLSLGALAELLSARLGVRFPRPTLVRIVQTCRGNPLYALELGLALVEHGGPLEPGEPLPVPDDLRNLLVRRLTRLSEPTREALLAASALAQPTEERVTAAVGYSDWLDEALAAAIIEPAGDEVRFAHPLLASVIYRGSSTPDRRRIHARLAQVVGDSEERARHLGAAAEQPGEEAAAALEQVAERAWARGAPEAAAGLAEQALALTPPEHLALLHHRRLAAATYHDEAGSHARARELLEQAARVLPPGRDRAEALDRLAWVRTADSIIAAQELLEQALDEVGDEDTALRARIELDLAEALVVGLVPGVGEHAQAALVLAERAGDPYLLARALSLQVYIEFHRHGVNDEVVRRVLALEEGADQPWNPSPSVMCAASLLRGNRDEEARAIIERVLERSRRSGRYRMVTLALALLATIEINMGKWTSAEHRIAEHGELVGQIGESAVEFDTLYIGGRLDVLRGRLDDARAKLKRCVEEAPKIGLQMAAQTAYQELALLALSLGNLAEAVRSFESADEIGGDSSHRGYRSHRVEALVGLGRLEEAEARTASLEQEGDAARPFTAAAAKRCRGLIAAAGGDFRRAAALLSESVAEQEQLTRPFELARTLLMLGSVARRARKKRAAREPLERALAIFDELGSPLWAEQARSELARIGGRAPGGGEPTATEQKVAQLAAAGRTNKEIAAELFMAVRTVESNLSRIYAKLGVRSRTELAGRVAGRNSHPTS